MAPILPSLMAYSIDDVALGNVLTVRSCCFEVRMSDGIARLRADAIYSVGTGRLTLVCMAGNARTYSCRLHGTEHSLQSPAGPSRRRGTPDRRHRTDHAGQSGSQG